MPLDGEFKAGKVFSVGLLAWPGDPGRQSIRQRKMPMLMQHDELDPIIEIRYCVRRYRGLENSMMTTGLRVGRANEIASVGISWSYQWESFGQVVWR
jgi:hypothetical protein